MSILLIRWSYDQFHVDPLAPTYGIDRKNETDEILSKP
jgi:hypothetical protein